MKDGYNNSVEPNDTDNQYDGPSKSHRNRDSHALQKLGVQLVALTAEQLRRIPMPETLAEAIELARKITAHEGRRRQMQYIGKLMRQLEVEPIQQALARMTDGDRQATALMHAAEHWRERLLAEPEALTRWMDAHPRCNRTRLESLINGARADAASGKPARAYSDLVRLLRDTLSEPAPGAETPPSPKAPPTFVDDDE